jgi:hypothetical protein
MHPVDRRGNLPKEGTDVTKNRKVAGIAAVIGTGLIAGAIGASVFGPGFAGAQTPTPSSKATSGTFHSNEEKTHEAGESAAREADEAAGRFRGGHFGPGGSNEEKSHEAGESAAREAQENANTSAAPAASPSA